MTNEEMIDSILNHVKNELIRAQKKYPSEGSIHGAYAVLLEEVLELQAEVFGKKRSRDEMRFESIQVSAMAIRLILDHLL